MKLFKLPLTPDFIERTTSVPDGVSPTQKMLEIFEESIVSYNIATCLRSLSVRDDESWFSANVNFRAFISHISDIERFANTIWEEIILKLHIHKDKVLYKNIDEFRSALCSYGSALAHVSQPLYKIYQNIWCDTSNNYAEILDMINHEIENKSSSLTKLKLEAGMSLGYPKVRETIIKALSSSNEDLYEKAKPYADTGSINYSVVASPNAEKVKDDFIMPEPDENMKSIGSLDLEIGELECLKKALSHLMECNDLYGKICDGKTLLEI